MNQILHIFRKDVRKHWLHIAISFALLIAFAWKIPMLWHEETGAAADQFSRMALVFIGASLVLSWWFLIVRVIQDESLVGDRQFWLTRPYQRRWLMAAKALFIVAFINVPVLIFDVALLAHAGFPPWRHGLGLCEAQFFLTLILIVPIAAISVISESLVQFLLILFVVIAYISALSWLSGRIPSSSAGGGEVPGFAAITIVVSAALILFILQYFRRDTWASRSVLAGSLGLVTVIVLAAPYDRLQEYTYPQFSPGAFVALSARIERPKDDPKYAGTSSDKNVSVSIPMNYDGLTRGTLIVVDAVRLSVYAPGGLAWNSGWVGQGHVLWPEPDQFSNFFNVSGNFYSSVVGKTVDIRVALALSEYSETQSQQMTVSTDRFPLTKDAICSAGSSWRSVGTTTLQCEIALDEPAYAAHLDPLKTSCTLPDATWPSLQVRRNDGNPIADALGGVGLLPVQPLDINFGDALDPTGQKSVSLVCPGTKFDFAKLELQRRYRIETEIRQVHLGSYRSYRFE